MSWDDPFGEDKPKSAGFAKLLTPGAKESVRKWRKELEARHTAKKASQKRMADYLLRQIEEDEIDNDWEIEFIKSIHARVHGSLPYLTEKQDAILTRLFEKY